MSDLFPVSDLLDVPPVAPARSFCRHLLARDGVHYIEAYESDAHGRFTSREIWFGASEGRGMLLMQWLEARGYEAVNGGRALYA